MSKRRSGHGVLTGRAARRYSERREAAEQRLADKEARIARLNAMTPEERRRVIGENQRIKEIERNGITLEHMMQAEKDAYERGLKDGENAVKLIICASVILALNELYGFGRKRCRDVMNLANEKAAVTFDSKEAILEVFDKVGLRMNYQAGPLDDLVEEVDNTWREN